MFSKLISIFLRIFDKAMPIMGISGMLGLICFSFGKALVSVGDSGGKYLIYLGVILVVYRGILIYGCIYRIYSKTTDKNK
jgi:hypothetical protein